MDIKKCTSQHCPLKNACYRTQNIEKGQPCFNFEYTCSEVSGFCDYIPLNQKKKKKSNYRERDS